MENMRASSHLLAGTSTSTGTAPQRFCELGPRRRGRLTSKSSHSGVICNTPTTQASVPERSGQCPQGQWTTNIQHTQHLWSGSFVLQILPLEITASRGQNSSLVRMSIRENSSIFFGLESTLKTWRNGLMKGLIIRLTLLSWKLLIKLPVLFNKMCLVWVGFL